MNPSNINLPEIQDVDEGTGGEMESEPSVTVRVTEINEKLETQMSAPQKSQASTSKADQSS
jgi:hypothetical protein